MEVLKDYYTAQAESQPDSAIYFRDIPVNIKPRMKFIRIAILAAAFTILLSATVLAASTQWFTRKPTWGNIQGYDDNTLGIAEVEGNSFPFSDDFRAYIDAGDWLREDSWDGKNSLYTFAEIYDLKSLSSVSDFFGVRFAYNALIPQETENVNVVWVAYDPIYDNAILRAFFNAALDNGWLVGAHYDFFVDDAPDAVRDFSYGYDNISDGEVDDYYYISPNNGIEALILPISPSQAIAVFSLDNVTYTLDIGAYTLLSDEVSGETREYNADIGKTVNADEALKAVIDAYR